MPSPSQAPTNGLAPRFTNITQDFRGDSLTVDGTQSDYKSLDYKEENRGFSVGGPIIADRLFVYGAYEEREEPEFIAQVLLVLVMAWSAPG